VSWIGTAPPLLPSAPRRGGCRRRRCGPSPSRRDDASTMRRLSPQQQQQQQQRPWPPYCRCGCSARGNQAPSTHSARRHGTIPSLRRPRFGCRVWRTAACSAMRRTFSPARRAWSRRCSAGAVRSVGIGGVVSVLTGPSVQRPVPPGGAGAGRPQVYRDRLARDRGHCGTCPMVSSPGAASPDGDEDGFVGRAARRWC
jgi:hypothetical protein